MGASLEIFTLGGLRIHLDGEAFTSLNTRKVEALLVYLAAAGRPHPREVLAEMFWGERSQSKSTTNLRVALTNLRKHLTPYISITRDTVALELESDFWFDATTLENSLARASGQGPLSASDAANIEQAIALYQGEFLQGFSVRDARQFEEWVTVERERLRQIVLDGLGRLVGWQLDQGEYSAGIQQTTRWLQLDPLMEAAHRQMMRLLAYSGQQGAALRQYQECLRVLDEELGLPPSEETVALYAAIQVKQLPPLRKKGVRDEEASREESPAPGDPPFRGLQYFDIEDADLFFGREQLTAKLVSKLGRQRFMAIVGASGSGKSSLVRAGLVPSLRGGQTQPNRALAPANRDRLLIHLMTPTARPLASLAGTLTREAKSLIPTATFIDDLRQESRALHLFAAQLVSQKDTAHLLLIVDQFEELFTLCRDETEREAFVDNLMTAVADDADGPITVVITLRADFYAHCAQFVALRTRLESEQVYIGQMTVEELRRAVEGPAKAADWHFEPGLVDLLLHDVGAGRGKEPEPGALPLLSHALLETWRQRRGRTMTYASYAKTGGVRRAIARTAEAVFNQGLAPKQRPIARNIFLRLTELGEGTQDTRRRVALEELITTPDEATEVEAVVYTLAEARLVTTSKGIAEVAHEALIREWPQLREWLAEDREGLRLHRQLTEAAQEWAELDRDDGLLYRGARLARASEWADNHAAELNPLEREFLESSKEFVRREDAEHEAQRQRELEAARKLAQAESLRAEEQRQASSRLRRRAFILAGALIVAAILAVLALSFGRQASQNAREAATNASIAQTAEAEAVALEAAAKSEALGRATQEAVAIDQAEAATTAQAEAEGEREAADEERERALAAEEAARLERDAAEEQARLATSRELAAAALDNLDRDPELSILLAMQGLSLAQTRESEEALHQAVQASRVQRTLSGHSDEVWGVALSPDGKSLATASLDGTAKVWDADSGQELFTLSGHTDGIWDIDFDPAGSRLATASADGTAKIWDVDSGQELLTLSGEMEWLDAVAFSPGGMLLITAGSDEMVTFWDISTPANTGAETKRELFTLTGHTGTLWDVNFSRDGTRLATAAADQTAKVWDVSAILSADNAVGQEPLTLSGHTGPVSSVIFSPDGTRLATSSLDGTAMVWDAESGQSPLTLGGDQISTYRVAFSPDGERLAAGFIDGTVILWRLGDDEAEQLFILSGHDGAVNDVVFSSDGARLITAGLDGTTRAWDVSSVAGKELLVVGEGIHSSFIRRLAISPDGKLVATAGMFDGTARVWDAESGNELFALSEHAGPVWDVAFNPDGTLLATAAADATARLWDTASGELLLTLSGHEPGMAAALPAGVTEVDFSPDGFHLATAGADSTVKVWDVSTPLGASESASRELFTLLAHDTAVKAVTFSQDGKLLATLGEDVDGTAKIWDMATALETGTAPDQELIAFSDLPDPEVMFGLDFSPDGRRLVASGAGIARVWGVSPEPDTVSLSGEVLFDLPGITSIVFGVAFSPDGTRIATAGQDGTARLWDADTGQPILTLHGSPNGVGHVAFGPDGKRLATANSDGTVRVFALTIEELVALAQARVTRSLNTEECRQYLHLTACP